MDAQRAVSKAKLYVEDLFKEEGIRDVRLEEVEIDELAGIWYITLGFLRRPEESPDFEGGAAALAAALSSISRMRRSFRVVKIRDHDGEVISVKQRERMNDAA